MNRRDNPQPSPVSGGGVLRRLREIEPNVELPPIVGLVGLRSMIEPKFSAMVAQIERRAVAPGALQ